MKTHERYQWKSEYRSDGVSFVAFPWFDEKRKVVREGWVGPFPPDVAIFIIEAVREKQSRLTDVK